MAHRKPRESWWCGHCLHQADGPVPEKCTSCGKRPLDATDTGALQNEVAVLAENTPGHEEMSQLVSEGPIPDDSTIESLRNIARQKSERERQVPS
jgi:hypothetical protein